MSKSILSEIKATRSSYKGSPTTKELVEAEIRKRFGAEFADNYDPNYTTRTIGGWRKAGFRVIKGSKAIQTVTFIEEKDEAGKVIKIYPKKINLFHYNMIERIKD